MPKAKPVTDDEISKLMYRIEDLNGHAQTIARRLHANGNTVGTPIDRVTICLATSGTLTDLANGLLRGHWLKEQGKDEPMATGTT